MLMQISVRNSVSAMLLLTSTGTGDLPVENTFYRENELLPFSVPLREDEQRALNELGFRSDFNWSPNRTCSGEVIVYRDFNHLQEDESSGFQEVKNKENSLQKIFDRYECKVELFSHGFFHHYDKARYSQREKKDVNEWTEVVVEFEYDDEKSVNRDTIAYRVGGELEKPIEELTGMENVKDCLCNVMIVHSPTIESTLRNPTDFYLFPIDHLKPIKFKVK